MNSRAAAPLVTVSFLLASPSAFAIDAFGGSIRGHGGVVDVDNKLFPAPSTQSPTPIAGKNLHADGTRGAGAIASELFFGFGSYRVGFDSLVAFGNSPGLTTDPLSDGFQVGSTSVLAGNIELFFGRFFQVGFVRPYVDLRAGVGYYTTPVRLTHPVYGFLGETTYVAYRPVFGPRIGVAVPLSDIFFIDLGGEASIFGFVRASGYAGIGLVLSKEPLHDHEPARYDE